ncbi:MAG: mechanosensitive ion channel family protein [Paludibacteraceae bacterium]
MLENIYYGNSLKEWLISFAIIIGSFLVSKIVLSINKKVISKTKRTNLKLTPLLFKTLQSPLLFGIVLAAIWIALSRLQLSVEVHKYISQSYKILIAINATWFANGLIHALIEEYLIPKNDDDSNNTGKHYLDEHKISLLKKTTSFIVWSIGLIMALNNVGVNLGALLGTLGVGGIALALAAQDTIKNIFGGFVILSDGTYRIGDRIVISNYDGVVESIGLRSTRIRTFDKRMVIIPNYKIMDGPVLNVTEAPVYRVVMTIGLTYSTSHKQMQKALEILKNIALSHPMVSNSDISATFHSFGDFSLNIRFCYYITKPTDVFDSPSEINLQILEQFNNAGLDFAFPTQTIQIDKETIKGIGTELSKGTE